MRQHKVLKRWIIILFLIFYLLCSVIYIPDNSCPGGNMYGCIIGNVLFIKEQRFSSAIDVPPCNINAKINMSVGETANLMMVIFASRFSPDILRTLDYDLSCMAKQQKFSISEYKLEVH